jgi:3-oxoacyl-[acyl-carrier-protein] synthase II
MSAIVFTGIGLISPLGIGREVFWKNCCLAQHGFRKIKTFDTSKMKCDVAGLPEDFQPGRYMPAAEYRKMSRIARLATAASIEALQDSGLALETVDRERIGIVLGTAFGSSSHLDEFYLSFLKDGPRGAQPFLFPETVQNAAASHVAIYHRIPGPNVTFCQNELSAENSLTYAVNLLEQDLADVVLVGGAEEVSATLFECFNAIGALNPIKVREGEKIQPLLQGGHILGEGAGVLVMEKREFALKRGARIYGRLGAAVLFSGPSEIGHYPADGRNLGRAIAQALEQAGLQAGEVDQIDLSANFSGELEQLEYEQITQLFAKQNRLRVTPLKYLIGECSGSSVLRAAACLLSLKEQIRLPSLDVEILKAEGPRDLVWEPAKPGRVRNVLMTSATYGGGVAAFVFQKEG